jgi:DNA mismatch endonuclease (patch repair protein)
MPTRDTKPELALRRVLHSMGLRYRVNARLPLKGVRRTGDVVFVTARVAVLVDSCWLHRCPQHYVESKSNADWWAAKIANNVRRDRDTDRRLRDQGWLVIRAWSHEDPTEVAGRVAAAVRSRVPTAKPGRLRRPEVRSEVASRRPSRRAGAGAHGMR